jgi:hypothetical protein
MRTIVGFAIVTLVSFPRIGAAQSWNIDARSVGLGGIGGPQNVFATTIAEDRGDRSIVLPLGLLQVLRDHSIFKSSSRDFDPVRVIEYTSQPLHLEFGRSRSTAGAAFVHDIRNAQLNPDLSAYQGFVPASMTAGGLLAPKYGYTFWVHGSEGGTRHGVYAGAGPHLSLRTALQTDPGLLSALDMGAEPSTSLANQRFGLQNDSTAQLAAAVTGGYRGRFAKGGASPDGRRPSEAGFVSVNVNYLHGIRYENVDLALRLDTDALGMLTSSDAPDAPLAFNRQTYSSGRGVSFDVGVGLSLGAFEMGLSGNNMGNTITWRNGNRRPYALDNLFSGAPTFNRGQQTPVANLRVVSPADYRGNLSFRGRALSLHGEVARESQDTWFKGGLEYVHDRLQFRGASSVLDHDWLPSLGLSVRATSRFWLDMAGFTTTSNVEHERRYAVATSIRLAPGN